MADEARTPRPFDVRTVKYLVRLMGRFDLSEIDLQEGEQRIRLRRGGVPAPAASAAPAHPPAQAQELSKPAMTPTPSAPAKKLLEIKAPTVGTFYAQKEPGAPPYVTVGTRVTPSTVVCLIEAMKVYNDVTADCTGVVVEVLVHDKEFVEFNTPLFRVDPTA